MKVIYRMCDIASTNPSPVFQEDKHRLNKLCLKSFLKAFEGVDIDITFLCDYCKPETIDMIQNLSPGSEVIQTAIGINETMLRSYMIAQDQNDDILFQECDYLYLPNTGKSMVEAVKYLGLVSPYDHLNFYIDRNLHSKTAEIELIGNHHFRSTERNTMTFGVRNDVFKKHYETFYRYGYLDGDVWYDLKRDGQQLYVPIPSLATHMVKDYMAPTIEWQMHWKTQT